MTVTEDQQSAHPLRVPAQATAPSAAREAINDMLEAGLLDEVMDRVDRDGLALTEAGGFLPELVKAVLERGLQTELTAHLGYEKGDPDEPARHPPEQLLHRRRPPADPYPVARGHRLIFRCPHN